MWSSWWNENWQGKLKYSEKTCHSTTFVHHRFHMTCPGIETALGRLANNGWKETVMAYIFEMD
jgi:hypothetical protein